MHSDLDRGGALKQLLRGLPEEAQPPYDFREFEQRARQRTLRPGTSGGGRLLPIAATLAVMSVVLLVVRFGTPPAPRIAADEAAAQASAAPAPSAAPEALEHWLAGLPDDPALVRVGSRAAVTGLEDRIAQLDDLLSAVRAGRAQPARLAALQQERTRLVGALVQVRYAETLANATQ
jgi:hypothetical protein